MSIHLSTHVHVVVYAQAEAARHFGNNVKAVHMYIHMSIHMYIYMSIHMSVHMHIHLSTRMSIHMPTRRPGTRRRWCRYTYLHACLYTCPCACLHAGRVPGGDGLNGDTAILAATLRILGTLKPRLEQLDLHHSEALPPKQQTGGHIECGLQQR